jgi:hypothetical protein
LIKVLSLGDGRRSISDAEEVKITEVAEDKTVAEEIRWFERVAFRCPLDQARHLPGFE